MILLKIEKESQLLSGKPKKIVLSRKLKDELHQHAQDMENALASLQLREPVFFHRLDRFNGIPVKQADKSLGNEYLEVS